jgi:hypothetical protein
MKDIRDLLAADGETATWLEYLDAIGDPDFAAAWRGRP